LFPSKPNVLFIGVDDLNNWTGCLGGHPDVKTPNIDRLARRGVLFANAHSSAPLCNPSRTSLITGILPSTSGIYTNKEPWRPVLPNAVTLPQYFIAQGYRVAGSGKIEHPALTTLRRNNHSIRSERWRYIRYSDGTEELYDHEKDKPEWTNLAGESEYAEVKKELAKWLPKFNAEEAPEERVYRKMERKRERRIKRKESNTKPN